MGISITRSVKFIRKGKGVIIAQSSKVYSYTESTWTEYYATPGRAITWANILNAADFSVGDTIVIVGAVSDKGNIPISVYAEVKTVSARLNAILAESRYYIISGQDGKPGQDGTKGERGAVLRGPQAWSDCAVGYGFQSGAEGEEFKDVVMYGNNYYSCIKSHTKTASNNPTSTTDTNNGYWKLADKFEMVATKILLAQYALVKNLGVEAIDMKDSAGNIIFQAKGGNVICNSGTFNSIKVTGDSEFCGTVKGVSGSFRSLNCVGSKGDIAGGIAFGGDGEIWIDGDINIQGFKAGEGRAHRLYSGDLWCRGMFGHYGKTAAVVRNTVMTVYTKGVMDGSVDVSLASYKAADGKTVYSIPLYGSRKSGDAAGMPIDVVVFNCTSDIYYTFGGMDVGKEWRVINGNDKQTVHFCDIGGWHDLGGGHSVNCIYLNPSWLNPVPSLGNIARGVFWTGETNLNWQ